MLGLINPNGLRCRRWCGAIVLLAVCSLTVSLATRYCLYSTTSDSTHTTLQKHTSPQAQRQRLLKNAAIWMPPVVSTDLMPAPRPYPRIAPAGPPIPSLFFEESLYNRPPPLLISFAQILLQM